MSEKHHGRRARKVGGKFQAEGHVVSTFTNLAGDTYHVFEFDVPPGMLHIYTPAQIEIYPGPEQILDQDPQYPQAV